MYLRICTDGKITFINKFAEQIFGYTNSEISGKSIIGTIVPAEDPSENELLNELELLKLPGNVRRLEYRNTTRDGRDVWITWANKAIVDDEGNIIEILCAGNDITEKKQTMEENEKMQTRLIQAQKMEAIGTLTSGLAHDFNNILGGIMGSIDLLQLLLKTEEINNREKSEKYLQMAVDSSKRASEMIHQLLLLSREQPIKLIPVDINILMEHVIVICRNSFPKSISLDVRYGERPMIAMADPSLIEQIFLNFCVNASHAMTIMRKPGEKEGGELRICISSLKSIKPGNNTITMSGSSADFISIEIKDTGVGMNKETQHHIFEPFFTTKQKGSGTGLGLSMAYGLISQLNGFMEIESEIGRGSSFSIFLPEIAEYPDQPYIIDTPDALITGDETILIIDDESTILEVAVDILRSCGYTILKASNGVEGISLYEKNRDHIDAVIIDISMPLMSGLEVFQKLKTFNDSVVALLSSGFSEDERITSAISLGAAGFIKKPYTAGELSRKVDEILQRKD